MRNGRRARRLSAVGCLLVVGSGAVVLGSSAARAAPSPVVPRVAAGDFSSFAVTGDGTLWSFGLNRYGQLGTPTNVGGFTPNDAPTSVLGGVVQVAAGRQHVLALRGDGSLWTFGDSQAGKLGAAPQLPVERPVPTQVGTGAVQIAAGGDHSLVVGGDGTLFTFGANRRGQLGTAVNSDTNTATSTPTAVLTGVVQVAAGEEHSLALSSDGTLWAFGSNEYGQLGTPTNSDTFAANPTPTPVLTDVARIAAGGGHSLALRSDGTLWTFGRNVYGQLGNGSTSGGSDANPTPTQVLAGVVDIAAGQNHSLALRGDGTLWGFGDNSAGQLGIPLVAPNAASTPTPVLTGVTQMAAGAVHSLVVRTDGSLWTFGGNRYGQLGTSTNRGTGDANPTPVAVLSGVGAAVGTSTEFVGLPPARLWDSRSGAATVDARFAGTGPLAGGVETALPVAGRGGVAASASAVVLNVTATDGQGAGFVTVWPCGQPRPLASNLNFEAGQTVPNLVIARVGSSGRVCFFASSSTHLVVDVTGAYPATSTFTGVVPARLLDSRPGAATVDGRFAGQGVLAAGSVTALAVTDRGGVPASSGAVVLNITVTEPEAAGYVTVFPCGQPRPLASNVNFTAGRTVANLTVARTGTDGTVCLFTPVATHLVVDVTGTVPTASSYSALVPARLLDSRPGAATVDGQAAGQGRLAAGSVTPLLVTGRGGVSAGSGAVVLNITVTEPEAAGYVTVFPCGQPRPLASNLNYTAGLTVANLAVAAPGAGGAVCLFTSAAAQLIADVTGAYPS